MKSKLYSALATLILALAVAAQAAETAPQQARTRDLGFDWRFLKGDPANAQQVQFDEAGWIDINLPHDWSIAGPIDEKNPGGKRNGFFPGGIGWYRKHFRLSAQDQGKAIFVQFDGVYENAEVWINGHSLGIRPYGYISFQHELTPFVKYGEDNVLAVRVENTNQPNGRWYTGSGIYRPVHLTVTDPLHVKHWGTFVTTPSISKDRAVVRVQTEIQSSRAQPRDVTLVTRIIDPQNKVVAELAASQTLSAQSEFRFDQEINVPTPTLWSIEQPSLYRVQTLVKSGQENCDKYETPFGIRDIRFDKDKGFVLNGEQVKMKGVCLHHDAGSLGSAVPVRALERRLEILKSIGCNAIRTSHNPPSVELLDLCDRMGFVIIDEAFDKWGGPVGRWFPQWWQTDLTDMIRRDRNHPSVVLWSVGNEIAGQGKPPFMEQLKGLVDLTRKIDPTRPVTLALIPFIPIASREENARKVNAIAKLVDVIGCNYQEPWFEDYRKENPEIVIIATESFVYYRGKDLTFDAFDPVNPWLVAAAHDYVAGTFYWTGIDYLGEADAGWPFHGWNGSPIDTCGFLRPVGNLQKSFWTQAPMVHIAVMDDALDTLKPVKAHWGWPKMVSHWNLPVPVGQEVKVVTFSNCPAVELLVNGRSMGIKKLADFPDKMIAWTVPYAAGRIEARGINQGEVKASHQLQTAGEPAQIRLIADRDRIQADGRDLCYVEVQITDKQGTLVPSAVHEIRFSVEGAGVIVGVDNGDLTSMESYKAKSRKAYYGRAQVIIQAARHSGPITLKAQVDGLPATQLTIDAR